MLLLLLLFFFGGEGEEKEKRGWDIAPTYHRTSFVTSHPTRQALRGLERTHPHILRNARGQGTYCAIDCSSPEAQAALIHGARQKGLEVAGSGTDTIRFRPMLTLKPKHVEVAINILDEVLSDMDE